MVKQYLGFMGGTLAHPMKFPIALFVFQQFSSTVFWDGLGLVVEAGDPEEASVVSPTVRVAGRDGSDVSDE